MGKLNIESIKKKSIKIIEPDFSYINGNYLRDFRMKLKMSQSLLAEYLGVSKKAIEKWEQGKNRINPLVARMIYLIECDKNILFLLKSVEIDGIMIDYKKLAFEVNSVNNDETINESSISYGNDFIYSQKWENKSKKTIGGIKYATTNV